MKYYLVIPDVNNDQPIITEGSLGRFITLWDNPISAMEFGNFQAYKRPFRVVEVDLPDSFPQVS